MGSVGELFETASSTVMAAYGQVSTAVSPYTSGVHSALVTAVPFADEIEGDEWSAIAVAVLPALCVVWTIVYALCVKICSCCAPSSPPKGKIAPAATPGKRAPMPGTPPGSKGSAGPAKPGQFKRSASQKAISHAPGSSGTAKKAAKGKLMA